MLSFPRVIALTHRIPRNRPASTLLTERLDTLRIRSPAEAHALLDETRKDDGTMPDAPPRVVVVVDDALLLREVYAGFLEEHGFTVALAADGVEALFQVKRLRPQGVVLDVRMPRVNGLEILSEIKAVDPSIRVVVVTGMKVPALREQALALGASAFLEKPIDRETLVRALTGDAT
jgi:CheY-like chemotaxis protein